MIDATQTNLSATSESAAPAEPPATVEQLQSQLSATRAELSALRAFKEAESADEVLIRQRMAGGLKREQAAAAVRRQKQFDASPHGIMVRARHASRMNYSKSPV